MEGFAAGTTTKEGDGEGTVVLVVVVDFALRCSALQVASPWPSFPIMGMNWEREPLSPQASDNNRQQV